MKKFILLLTLILFITNVKAYENNIVKIDIDESYKLEYEKNNAIRWTKDNKYIAISISNNKKLKYDIKSWNQAEIDKQKEYLENGINKGLSKYDIKSEVTNIIKKNNNEAYYLEYDIYYPSKKTTGYDMFQKGRMWTTNNYIVTIIYSSDSDLEKDDNCLKTLDSLVILDNYDVTIPNTKWFIWTLISIGTIAGIIGAIISMKKKHK